MNFLPLCLISVGLVLSQNTNEDVIELTASNFEAMTKENKVLVKFYTAWCGFCTQMKTDYINLAKKLKKADSEIKVGEVDCDKHRAACNGVRGYPTLKFYRKGSSTVDFGGPRKTNPMYDFLMSNA